jgi:hypothetical protein
MASKMAASSNIQNFPIIQHRAIILVLGFRSKIIKLDWKIRKFWTFFVYNGGQFELQYHLISLFILYEFRGSERIAFYTTTIAIAWRIKMFNCIH